VRRLAALVLLGCSSSCPPTTAAQIQSDYAAAVLKRCAGYPSIESCPAGAELKASRLDAETKAGCR
jgi:hypothetical protein